MDKLRLKVHKEVLKDVSAHFDGAEKIILEKIEEICTLQKINVEQVIFLLLVLVLWCVVGLSLALKIGVCYAIKESTKQKAQKE